MCSAKALHNFLAKIFPQLISTIDFVGIVKLNKFLVNNFFKLTKL